MNSQHQIEELFDAAMQRPPDDRTSFLGKSDYPQTVKDAAGRLIKAFESKSKLLNDNLLADIAQIDSNFFDTDRLEAESKFEKGEWVGRFQIDEEIGKGGMSIVYRAKQKDPIKRDVALKMLRSSLLAPRSVMRFLREQQALALVSHPNIATLYEVGSTESGLPFAAMELVDGTPITDFCDQHELSEKQRLRLFLKVGDALSHAHKHGIIHRDAKPGNILVEAHGDIGNPKLIDFGIAKILNEDFRMEPTVTQLGQILGSPRYMSPEQLAGDKIDHRSDIYSSALVLFELLSGTPYRIADSNEELVASINRDELLRLSHRMKENSSSLATKRNRSATQKFIRHSANDFDWILAKALSRDPESRYQTMEDFRSDIDDSLHGRQTNAPKPSKLKRTLWALNSARVTVGAIAGLLALLSIGFGINHWRNAVNELQIARQDSESAQQATLVSDSTSAAANEFILGLLANLNLESEFNIQAMQLIPIYEKQVEAIEKSGGPVSDEHTAVYGILAVSYAMSGEFEKSAAIISNVTDEEKAEELKLARNQICFEYENKAKKKLKELRNEEDAMPRARQLLLLGRCYFARDNHVEAEKILKESIAYFDHNDTFCADSLFARHALLDVLAALGETEERTKLLAHTKLIFINRKRAVPGILSTPREQEIFGKIMEETKGEKRQLFDHLR